MFSRREFEIASVFVYVVLALLKCALERQATVSFQNVLFVFAA